MALKRESRWFYQKRIEELERQNAEARADLYQYRTAVLEIYDAIAAPPDGSSIRAGFLLNKIKRCLK